jgi:acetyl-CoA acyltransferase 1
MEALHTLLHQSHVLHTMASRIDRLAAQLTAASPSNPADDVVIVAAVRTPLCRAKRGGLASMTPDLLLAPVLKEAVVRSKVPLKHLQDICIGNVLQPGGGAMMARMAQFLAGLPEEIPLSTVNRQCSSGLQALIHIAGASLTAALRAAWRA